MVSGRRLASSVAVAPGSLRRTSMPMTRTFTREELQAFNGRDGRPTYAAFNGKVYDVSTSPLWEEGEHFEHFAGKDLTDELPEAPHGEEVFENFLVVGELLD